MSFFLLSTWVEELISTPNIITFWLNPPLGNERLDFLSNPIPQPEYPYKVTAPNKQFSSVGSLEWELEALSSKTV